VTNIQTVKFS